MTTNKDKQRIKLICDVCGHTVVVDEGQKIEDVHKHAGSAARPAPAAKKDEKPTTSKFSKDDE